MPNATPIKHNKMKRIILFFCLCLITTLASFAQTVLPAAEPETSFLIDLGSFTGIVALVSTLVTQILKVVPAISASKLAKILISCGVGMVVCLAVATHSVTYRLYLVAGADLRTGGGTQRMRIL